MSEEVYRVVERDGWAMDCPKCASVFSYTSLKIWNAPEPFFYCNRCNNVRMSEKDRLAAEDLTHLPDDELLRKWEGFVSAAPPCPCGGQFTLWSNVRCPHCDFEFPYNDGIRDAHVRTHDQGVVVVDSAVILNDTFDKSWKAAVKLSGH